MRKLLALLIVIFWLGSVYWLFEREVWLETLPVTPQDDLEVLLEEEESVDRWIAIYYDGGRVGTAWSSLRTEYDAKGEVVGYRVRNHSLFAAGELGPQGMMQSDGWMRLDGDGQLEQMKMVITAAGTRLQASGAVEGNELRLTMKLAGQPIERVVELPEDGGMTVTDIFTPMPWVSDLEEGKPYKMPILDAQTLTPGEARVTVTGRELVELAEEEYDAYVVETRRNDMTFRSWVTEDGEVVKQTTPLGLVFEKEPERVRRAFEGLGARPDRRLAFAPSSSDVEEPRQAVFLKVRLLGQVPGQLPNSDRQQLLFADGERRLEIRSVELPPTFEVKGRPAPPELDDSAAEELLEQLAHLESGADGRARLLLEWMRGDTPEPVMPWSQFRKLYPGSLEVSDRLVRIARALGIPARMALGLVAAEGGFFFHTWIELELRPGVWQPVDPLLGQIDRLDATHIKLRSGPLQEVLHLAAFAGRLRVEPLDAR